MARVSTYLNFNGRTEEAFGFYRGIFGGETSFSGSGAGGSPTAVAVVSDVLSVAGHGPAVPAAAEPTTYHKVKGDFVAPHYVRFTVNDKPIEPLDLEGVLQDRIASAGDNPILVLHVDQRVPAGVTVGVLDIAKRNKWKVIIATRPK